ncbi:MAG TPA: hypothetical protein VKE24_09735 [Candidatus Acidoferrales bacterium]|nr:hypothetical protein [Candidatus Acidoferrales bacterium]
MLILREWRAEVRRERRDEYLEYVRRTGLREYRAAAGHVASAIAVRDLDEVRSEIVTLSWWESWDALRRFAGDPPDRARYFPADREFLLTVPERVQHYASTDLGAPAQPGRQG